MDPRARWLIVGGVVAASVAVVVLLSAWNTDVSGPGVRGRHTSDGAGDRGSMAVMAPLAAGADGLKATAAGLTLDPASGRLRAGAETTWRFSIRDAAGRAVTRFERDQTKLLHLIVVRRDLTDYQHLHPVLGRDGEFSIPIAVARPGTYRAVADFTTAGKRHVLGTDLTVPGRATDRALPGVATEAVVDGYRVRVNGEAEAGRDSRLTLTVSRDGRAIEDLEPYLGAYGHLVALSARDLAYAHVHPTSTERAGGAVSFNVELPTKARYRLFFQFRAEDAVRTVAFTVRAS